MENASRVSVSRYLRVSVSPFSLSPVKIVNMLKRCAWPRTDLAIAYHDREWGVPVHDDRGLFEFLILEGAQAGLSWSTILKKRENYRRGFPWVRTARIPQH